MYDGQWSEHRKKAFGVKAEEKEGKQFVVFSQNHDQVGNRMLGERTSVLASFEMQKLMAAAVMVSPFLPMLFMGEEWSEPNPFLYFVSHTDKELAEAVRKGRKEEFASFHAEGEAPDPMDEQTFLQSKLQWDLVDKEPHTTMLRYYKNLIALRKHHRALHHLNRKQLSIACSKENNTLLLHRWHHEQHIVCGMNFSQSTQNISLPQQNDWQLVFDSAGKEWSGPGTIAAEKVSATRENAITLQPESIVIYTNLT